MTSSCNVAAKQSFNEVEGDDEFKTLECLRGRLFAERAASKAANEEAHKLGNKLIELENKLKQDVKWRNKSEKRLKSLMKKLESMKIIYVVSDESSSEYLSNLKKSDVSSFSSSSTPSSFTCLNNKQNDKKKPSFQMRKSSKCELDKAVEKRGSTLLEILKHTDTTDDTCSGNQCVCSHEKIKFDKTISDNVDDDLQCTQFSNDEELDDHRHL